MHLPIQLYIYIYIYIYIYNTPFLPIFNGSECNGVQGYYSNNTTITHCTADNLKIVEYQ